MITKIKEFRISQGLSQERLAALVTVRRETMVFLEKGKYNPSLRLACRTAKVLNTTVDELFSFDDEEWTYDLNGEMYSDLR